MLDPGKVLEDLALGCGIGYVGGVFGISGGIVAIPALAFLGLPQQLAQGTSLIGQLPSVAMGVFQYRRRSNLDLRLVRNLVLGAAPFALLGAITANTISSASLRRAFALFIVAMASYTLWNALRRRDAAVERRRITLPLAFGVGAISGFLSGIFGIGGAAFAIPTLTLLFGLPQTEAQGFGLVVILPSIVISIITYAHAGQVDWKTGIPLGIGSITAVSLGVALAHRLPDRVLRLAFCALLYAGAGALWSRV